MWKNRWHEIVSFIGYAMKAKGPHGVHSPFVYNLITKVLKEKRRSAEFETIENLRAQYRKSNEEIVVTDFGAGSRTMMGDKRSVGSITRTALQPASHARALAMIAAHANAKYILELGTSLGITTAHIATSVNSSIIYTIEGSSAICRIAQSGWEKLGLSSIVSIEGSFDTTLESTLKKMPAVDCVIIDGNHRGEACLRYIESILPYANEHTVFVVDDIYWSSSMTLAWMKCVDDNRFSLSLDFFDFGVLYRSKGRVKEHFVLKRPWR
jgi:predicted O-methyltransferase YrrM